MKTKKLLVTFNKKEYQIEVNKKHAVNSPELELLIKDMSKLMGYHASKICAQLPVYTSDYLEVWNLMAETALYLLPKFNAKKSSWNTFYTNYAPRTVRRILSKINRSQLIEICQSDVEWITQNHNIEVNEFDED